MIISMIVAMGKNRVIGKDNQLIWRLKDDMKNFVRLTKGNHILVGRKTFESFGKPLPNRTNLILTRNKDYHVDGTVTCLTVEQAIEVAKENKAKELVVCGGEEIYKMLLPKIDKLYLTVVDCELDGDAYFPQIDLTNFEIGESLNQEANEQNEFNWEYKEYLKRT